MTLLGFLDHASVAVFALTGALAAVLVLTGGAELASRSHVPAPTPELALTVCAAVTLALRAGSIAFGWKLPVYRARPPRS